MEKKLGLSFPILHDEDNRVAEAFGLKIELEPEMQALYTEFGIDVPRHNGTATWQLPIATRYIVHQDGKVTYAVADPDYTTRPNPEETLEALKAPKG